MLFFTADLHLGHANIIKHCDRPFSSVYEMDRHLISLWNQHVHKHDSVYIVGDLIFRNRIRADDYLDQLNGEKHLILGNHDSKWIKKVDMSKYFATVDKMVEISHNQHKIVLCHYPMMSWNRMAHGSYMIHGHVHNNREARYFSLIKEVPNLLNAGVDINGFHPVEFDELIQNNYTFKTMKTEKEAIDDIVTGFAPLAEMMQSIIDGAISQYTPVAEDIIAGRITGENEIALQLDCMLDFCHSDKFLPLYNRVLESLSDKYPELVESYIQAYSEMWVSDEDDIIDDAER